MDLRLEHDTFETTIGVAHEAAERFRGARDRVAADVDALLHDGWRGVAAESFAEGWADWHAGAQDVLDGLVAMGQLLEAVHVELGERDADSRVALDAVAARIVDRLGA